MESAPIQPSPVPSPIRVLVVDDSVELTEVLCLLIEGEPGLECVGVLHEADGLLEALKRLRPDVAIVDLTMNGHLPIDAIREAARDWPSTRCVAYSGRDDPDVIRAAADAGSWGFVSKQGDPTAILKAIRRVACGEKILPVR